MNKFNPNWVSRPSGTVKDILYIKDLKLEDLRKALNMDHNNFDLFIDDKMEITSDLAEQLEKYLGGSKQFWLNRYNNFFVGLKQGKTIV